MRQRTVSLTCYNVIYDTSGFFSCRIRSWFCMKNRSQWSHLYRSRAPLLRAFSPCRRSLWCFNWDWRKKPLPQTSHTTGILLPWLDFKQGTTPAGLTGQKSTLFPELNRMVWNSNFCKIDMFWLSFFTGSAADFAPAGASRLTPGVESFSTL